jgi:hypothetical protein
MSNEGKLANEGLVRIYIFSHKYVVPIAFALVLLVPYDQGILCTSDVNEMGPKGKFYED